MSTKKKLLRTVSLRFFEDDGHGEWGVTHEETMQANGGSTEGFNAFWDGRGIFHDVFEHAHEFTDKHFLGTCAMNVGGEVAAMGALWYYYNQCGFSSRLNHPLLGYVNGAPDKITMDSTLDMMREAISSGHCNFGHTLESCVPAQKETDDGGLEYMIQEHFDSVQREEVGRLDKEAKDIGREYKESVTLEKLQNLYRYGYKLAQKLYPEGLYRNGGIMSEFMEFWTKLCKANRAEDVATYYRKLIFKLYRDADGLCHWTAEFIPHAGSDDLISNVRLKGGPDGIPSHMYILP